jgi:hypothetical protein
MLTYGKFGNLGYQRILSVGFLGALALMTTYAILYPTRSIVLAVIPVSILVLWAVWQILNANAAAILVAWVLIFPLGYKFGGYPLEKSIFTLDRGLIIALFGCIAFSSRRERFPISEPLFRSALAWTAFAMLAGISLMKAGEPAASTRWYVDGVLLPSILGWSVVRSFRVREHLARIHTNCCLMASYVFLIGGFELVTGESALKLPGAQLVFAGNLARPNGPFYSDDSFALISLTSFFFLLFLRHALGEQWSARRQVLHYIGTGAALGASLMPMFRSVGITLFVILVLDYLFSPRSKQRAKKLALMTACVILLVGAARLAPAAYSDRSNPDNFYVRLAEQKQIFSVFLDHPFFGVGYYNFADVATKTNRYGAEYNGIQSVDTPHNTLGGILSETGIVGFVPYVLAQCLLVVAFLKLKRSGITAGAAVWKYFLYVFLGYWISGFTLASGYSSDLNLWFMFVCMAMYKYAVTGESSKMAKPLRNSLSRSTARPSMAMRASIV